MNKTSNITAVKTVGDRVVITTTDNTTVWADISDYTPRATKVTYEPFEAGHEYKAKDGSMQKSKSAGNLFVGFDVIKEREGIKDFAAKAAVLQQLGVSVRI